MSPAAPTFLAVVAGGETGAAVGGTLTSRGGVRSGTETEESIADAGGPPVVAGSEAGLRKIANVKIAAAATTTAKSARRRVDRRGGCGCFAGAGFTISNDRAG